jgi:hypothetical protein
MQLVTYLGGITVALLLAFYLPSHLLTVREQMRRSLTETKSVRMIPAPPPKASPQSTDARSSEALEIPAALTSVPEKDPRATKAVERTPEPPPITYTPHESPVRQSPAKAAQRGHREQEANLPKNVAGHIPREPRKLASRPAKVAVRSETIPRAEKPEDGRKFAADVDFWWKKLKDRGAKNRHAGLDPTDFWWR